MRIVSIKALREFWEQHADSEFALRAWYHDAKRSSWRSFEHIKKCHRNADCLAGNRVIFNIKGNHYRLVVQIHYNSGRVFIRFIGTHAEYDKINAETI